MKMVWVHLKAIDFVYKLQKKNTDFRFADNDLWLGLRR